MIDLSTKVVCVIDFGNYIEIARRLAKDFEKVYYYCPWIINGFPEHNPLDIGRGVKEIIKVTEWEPYYEEIDLFVFPDLFLAGQQELLRRQGKLVYGSGKAGELEVDRGSLKRLQEELGMNVNPYEEVEGLYELEERLKVVEDKYIKSSLRGDLETFHHENYTLSKEELKALKHRMGIFDKKENYIIENPIESIAEIGYDGFVIDGQYPKETCSGFELKDVGYLGSIVRYNTLPKQLKDVTDKLAPIFQTYGYRGPMSTEVRIDEKRKGYLIDITCRSPQPPTDLALEMYDNFSEMVWNIASGIVPEIKYTYNWGCQFIIKSESAETQPVAIQFPEKYARFVKIKNLVVDDDGTYYYTPNGVRMQECASVIGLGHSADEAIRMATEIAKTVKGFDLKIKTDCIEDAKEQMKILNKNGIKFL